MQQLSFEVFLRQGKLLLALAAAKKAQQLSGGADPDVHSMVARLADAVAAAAAAAAEGAADALPPVALEVALEETAALLGAGEATAAAAAAYRQQWAAQHAGSSLRHAAAAAEVALPDSRSAAVQRVVAAGPAGASHAECAQVLHLLEARLGLAEAAAQWRQACAAHFRWSALFGAADRVEVPAPWEAAVGSEEPAAAVNGIAAKTSQLAI